MQKRRDADPFPERESGDKRVDVGENEEGYWEEVGIVVCLIVLITVATSGGGRRMVLFCLLKNI